MSDAQPRKELVDVSLIADPDVRRAFHAMNAIVARQQQEIEAMLELLLEKHVGSIGEFRRQFQKVQHNDPRAGRLHEQLAAAAGPGARPLGR